MSRITITATNQAGATSAMTIIGTSAPTKPLLGATPPYGNAVEHLYLGVDLKTQGGVSMPRPMPQVVNLKGYVQGMDPKTDSALWPQIAAGTYDANLRTFAAAAKADGVKILALNHEPMAAQGTPASLVAAHRHEYAVIKPLYPGLLIGPCYLGEWADPGWVDNNGVPFPPWYPGDDVVDILTFDRYPVFGQTGQDYATLISKWRTLGAAHGKKLAHLEVAAPTGTAAAFYRSIKDQVPGMPDVAAVVLWLSKGPRADYRVSTLTTAERAALDELVASPAFGRSL